MPSNVERSDPARNSSVDPCHSFGPPTGHGGSPKRFQGLQMFPEPRLQKSQRATLLYGWKYAFGSWLNLLLFCMPASWATNTILKKSHSITFILCILALIPLVRFHDISTRELSSRIGGSKTGLLNGSMSNFVEIVVAISALRKCELKVVHSMLVGSMLSKLLLVLGLCFLAGGMKFSEQDFNPTATQIHSSLLSLSVGAVVLPAAYHFMLDSNAASLEAQRINILKMSHAVSIVLLFIYLAYLLFQLWSHTHLYRDKERRSNRLSAIMQQTKCRHKIDSQRFARTNSLLMDTPSPDRCHFFPSPRVTNTDTNFDATIPDILPRSSIPDCEFACHDNTTFPTTFYYNQGLPAQIPPQRKLQMSWFLTIFLLIVVTGSIAVTVDLLVASMDEISSAIHKEWVGLILLPAVSSVAECITAVKVSVKDELTLSVSVAVGSTIQTALFVIPLTVILAWCTNKPLSLLLDPFQSMVLYITVNTMGYVVGDGKSNWLDGIILICLYIIIAVSFWFYPGSDVLSILSAACTIT